MRKPPRNTYYMGVDRNGQVLMFAPDERGIGGLPMPLAAQQTAAALAEFGRSEGIRRTIYEIERYLNHANLEAQKKRIIFNSKEIALPDGRKFQACASCSHSADAEEAFWAELINSLKQELANPPKIQANAIPAEDMPAPEGEE